MPVLAEILQMPYGMPSIPMRKGNFWKKLIALRHYIAMAKNKLQNMLSFKRKHSIRKIKNKRKHRIMERLHQEKVMVSDSISTT